MHRHKDHTALRGWRRPNAKNGELKSLVQTGLRLFTEHLAHAEGLAMKLR